MGRGLMCVIRDQNGLDRSGGLVDPGGERVRLETMAVSSAGGGEAGSGSAPNSTARVML